MTYNDMLVRMRLERPHLSRGEQPPHEGPRRRSRRALDQSTVMAGVQQVRTLAHGRNQRNRSGRLSEMP